MAKQKSAGTATPPANASAPAPAAAQASATPAADAAGADTVLDMLDRSIRDEINAMVEPEDQASTRVQPSAAAEPAPAPAESTEESSAAEPEPVTELPPDSNQASQSPEPAPEEPSAEPGPEDDDSADLDELAKHKRWPGSYLRRLKKLTDRAAAAEAKVAELTQAQAPPPETPPPPPIAPPPAGGSMSRAEQALETQLSDLEFKLDWCDEHPDGASIPDPKTGQEINYSTADVRKFKRQVQARINELQFEQIQLRRAMQSELQQSQARAVAEFPFLKDPNAPETKMITAALQYWPALRQIPQHLEVLALYAAHRRAQMTAAAGKSPPRKQAPPASPGTKPAAAPPPVNAKQVTSAADRKAWFESGDLEAGKRHVLNLIE